MKNLFTLSKKREDMEYSLQCEKAVKPKDSYQHLIEDNLSISIVEVEKKIEEICAIDALEEMHFNYTTKEYLMKQYNINEEEYVQILKQCQGDRSCYSQKCFENCCSIFKQKLHERSNKEM